MYIEQELVSVGKRENNKKRNYLVINPLQGKHIPVSPGRALELFDALADLLKDEYKDEKLLLIGFAETATAIGAAAAVRLGANYIQTTREEIMGADYLYFTEAHSHAAEQKLVKNDVDRVIGETERIVFIEDELTTGNTILNIIRVMEEAYGGNLQFSAASLLNGMTDENLGRYEEKGVRIHYILKTNHKDYGEIADRYAGNGSYEKCNTEESPGVNEYCIPGWRDARRLVNGRDYQEACEALQRSLENRLSFHEKESVLVIGTEEFMYPALYIGDCIEKRGCKVRFHATTRSPIAVSTEEDYPLSVRYELRSLYAKDRRTFIYDIQKADRVLIITDAHCSENAGKNSLIRAVLKKNETIDLIRWC
ncbi:MAG: hypothetical protein HFH11_11970 [Dorea sp.]|nr:hypothetical protein [Dorea sp.]